MVIEADVIYVRNAQILSPVFLGNTLANQHQTITSLDLNTESQLSFHKFQIFRQLFSNKDVILS